MSDASSLVFTLLLLGTVYLCMGRSVSLKRWVLPMTTAGVAAVCGLMLARSSGGTLVDYAIGVPLGLSAGLVLQHFLDYCRRCGAMRPISLSRVAPCRDCKEGHELPH